MQRTSLWICVLVTLPFLAPGAQPEEKQARIERLEAAVLAPCCYTQTVAQHQSEVAIKMRLEIASWVDQGKTDDEILGTYAVQYGKKVLVDPKTRPRGWMMVIPWAALVVGLLGATWIVWHWRTRRVASPEPAGDRGMVLPDVSEIED